MRRGRRSGGDRAQPARTASTALDASGTTAREVLTSGDVSRALRRIAHEILERNKGADDLVLLGIPTPRRRARPAARRRHGRGRGRPGARRQPRHHDAPRRPAPPADPRRWRAPTSRPAGSTTRSSCSSTTCSTPAAPSAPPSTRSPSSAARAPCGWPSSSTAATASCRSAPTTSARTCPTSSLEKVQRPPGRARRHRGRRAHRRRRGPVNRHLLSIGDLTRDDVGRSSRRRRGCTTCSAATSRRSRPCAAGPSSTSSSRTPPAPAARFEIAGKWMSADTINITGKGSSTSKGESLRDTVRTIDAMAVDALVIRHMRQRRRATRSPSGSTRASSTPATAPTSTRPRPCSTPTRSSSGSATSTARHVAIVGDLTHCRVFRSNAITLRTLGAHVTLVAPPTLMPSGIADWAQPTGSPRPGTSTRSSTAAALTVRRRRDDAARPARADERRLLPDRPRVHRRLTASPATACGRSPTPTRTSSSATRAR